MSYTHICVSRRQTYTAVVQSNNNIIIYLLKRARKTIKCDFYPDYGFIALEVSCSSLRGAGIQIFYAEMSRDHNFVCRFDLEIYW